jgi:transposase-like protein
MSKYSRKIKYVKEEPESAWSVLEEIARNGAQKMLQLALESEVEEYVEKHSNLTGEDGKRAAVKNGYMQQRNITTGMGPLTIKQPRVDDRDLKKYGHTRFTSSILPKYMRRIPSVDNLLPVLYLKGISTNDFPAALSSILGKNAPGLSSANIVRLKKIWEDEYKEWKNRDLSDKNYVYFWVDGIYFNIRLEEDRSCMLVIMAADRHGEKELLSVSDGYRESKIAWREILLDLKKRGLSMGPKLSIGDGGLGFWAALDEVYPETKRQRCWVHKTSNILDKLPKSMQPKAKSMIKDMYMAPSKEKALEAYSHFVKSFQDKYPKAVNCLTKDKKDLFTFYDFPSKHWIHIRTTNPIESTFATVRQRTTQTKGCGSRIATLTMVFKLAKEASKTWIRLQGHKLILKVLDGAKFVDGELEEEVAA